MEKKDFVNLYKSAWENQNTELILSIFDKDCEYIEYPFEENKIYNGLDELKKYWDEKVVKEQEDIKIEIENIYETKNEIISEMNIEFFSKATKMKYKLKHIGIFEIKNDKIKKYKDFWHSKKF